MNMMIIMIIIIIIVRYKKGKRMGHTPRSTEHNLSCFFITDCMKHDKVSNWYELNLVGRCCPSDVKPRPQRITPARAGALSASMASSSE